jgi:hypothetical protein
VIVAKNTDRRQEHAMKRIPAGNVEFHVETREGGRDGGPSIQMRASVGGEDVQILRFDCFRIRPHYHYAPGGDDARYDIDPTLVSDSLAWVMAQLRSNLAPMVERAGYPAVAEAIDPSALLGPLSEVEAHFQAAAARA